MKASPSLPSDVQNRIGDTQDVFGPNRSFRRKSAVMGLALVVLGAVFCGLWISGVRAGGGNLYALLGGMLIVSGTFAIKAPRQVPLTWVFVGSQGLARVRGELWESVAWSEVKRVDDLTRPGLVQIVQCRVLMHDGREWGFLSDIVADCPRLFEVLKTRVKG
jgi:hypothetical protein